MCGSHHGFGQFWAWQVTPFCLRIAPASLAEFSVLHLSFQSQMIRKSEMRMPCDFLWSLCVFMSYASPLLLFAFFCFLCSRTYAMPSRCTAGRQNPRSPEHVLEHINFSTNLVLRNKFPKVLKTSNFWVLKTWGHGALGENQIQWRGGWVNPHVKSNGAKK